MVVIEKQFTCSVKITSNMYSEPPLRGHPWDKEECPLIVSDKSLCSLKGGVPLMEVSQSRGSTVFLPGFAYQGL